MTIAQVKAIDGIGSVHSDGRYQRLTYNQQFTTSANASRLAQLHDAGFVHGDVKLANVIARESDVRIFDLSYLSRRIRKRWSPLHGGSIEGASPRENTFDRAVHTSARAVRGYDYVARTVR
jgi:serine/threonine protein kinase